MKIRILCEMLFVNLIIYVIYVYNNKSKISVVGMLKIGIKFTPTQPYAVKMIEKLLKIMVVERNVRRLVQISH